jgi:hypothetical protein
MPITPTLEPRRGETIKHIIIKIKHMKISYRNYPILEKIQKGKFGEMNVDQLDVDFFYSPEWQKLYEIFKKNTKYFLSEINVISEPFQEACKKSGDKLLDLLREMAASKEYDLNYNGTFIESGGYTYLLKYSYKKETACHFVSLYWFSKNLLEGCYYADDCPDNASIWLSDFYKKSFNLETDAQMVREACDIMSRLIVYKLFKTYAEVETKELLANSVLREVDCKYVNDTQLSITYLDSKWFTNLVKSDAFNVRGHFRLHACGKGLQDHKLIWISEYTKSGYTAPARMLSQTNNKSTF